jgi:uncharacterized protein YijF (DUF1287 family)
VIWKALAVEVIRQLWDRGLYRQNKVLQQIHANWFTFWVEWKTQKTIENVDRQVAEIQEQWAKEDPKPVIIEHEPDGSNAQELLGGTMEIKAPWYEADSTRSL